MRLKRIKVYGFKSFVDPTTITVKGRIAGVVGPNGCGKSNVIDAVRWVMGESSAKTLRGDNMEDVIFNGSRGRQPVGKASVELLFDNSLGRIKSHFKNFSEIAVQRTLTREGKSEYRINDKKVRRKDVLDLFRGTGLGPRSYSIIEQGMVSRIVEAKPEDLRTFVEEAAGISRYKDRRRETENRIRNTRENLERLEDVRGELSTQLARLKRQANAAERYRALQNERHERRAEQYRWRLLELEELQLADKERAASAEVALQKSIAAQREHESLLEKQRAALGQQQETLNQAQASYYEVGAKVSKIEQKIANQQDVAQQRERRLNELNESLARVVEATAADVQKQSDLKNAVAELAPELENAEQAVSQQQSAYDQANATRNRWQETWDQFNHDMQQPAHQKQVLESTIAHLGRQQSQTSRRLEQLQSQAAQINLDQLEREYADKSQALKAQSDEHEGVVNQVDELERSLSQQRETLRTTESSLTELRSQQSALGSRLQSLLEIQAQALDTDDSTHQAWLSQTGLGELPQLATRLQVSPGWERAADRVLGVFLDARVDDQARHALWQQKSDQAVILVSTAQSGATVSPNARIALPALSSVIRIEGISLAHLLGSCYVAEELSEALGQQEHLAPNESIVTKSGIWLGCNWISHVSDERLNTGYLVREEEIQRLTAEIEALKARIAPLESESLDQQQRIDTDAEALAQLRGHLRTAQPEIQALASQVSHLSAGLNQQRARLEGLNTDVTELIRQQQTEDAQLAEAQESLLNTGKAMSELEAERTALVQTGDSARQAYETAMQALKAAQHNLHELRLKQTRLLSEQNSIDEGHRRLHLQQQELESRHTALLTEIEAESSPGEALKGELEAVLKARQAAETELKTVREQLSKEEGELREAQLALSQLNQHVTTAREQLERENMGLQAVRTRREALLEEMEQEGFPLESLGLDTVPEQVDVTKLLAEARSSVQSLEAKIARIGPVNLVAIDEYETQSERAEYLQKQHDDLTAALETLEAVIRKIDRETKTRFSATFDQLNTGFSEFFPKLFGGGRATLSLTSDDLLTTGIVVAAQPPGKRNSHIHLLSGGEKALTAVSLLFALFKLNPAPFCMMDEVDAPLDDANVSRFCDTLNSLADHSQIVVITHNKITMQHADTLVGVTQNEPGVSRVVSVNLEHALKMVDDN